MTTLDGIRDHASDLELAAMVDAEADAPAPELDPAREVDALSEANRHLWHVNQLRHELDVHDQVFQREINRITDRAEERRTILQQAIEWHLTPVRQLHKRLVEMGRAKTIHLPHGTLKMRVPEKPQVFIDDVDELATWARTQLPELLPPPDKVKVTDLRRTVVVRQRPDGSYAVLNAVSGEVVPGCHAEVPAATWNADTEGEEL